MHQCVAAEEAAEAPQEEGAASALVDGVVAEAVVSREVEAVASLPEVEEASLAGVDSRTACTSYPNVFRRFGLFRGVIATKGGYQVSIKRIIVSSLLLSSRVIVAILDLYLPPYYAKQSTRN